MNKILSLIAILLATVTSAQIPTYYNGVDFDLSGMALKNALSSKITSTHTNQISYSQATTLLKQSDLDPTNSGKVILVYGWNDNDAIETNDRTRGKNNFGGSNTGEWNREHVFPKSLGSPNLGTSGPGSDAHNLRPADVDNNGLRGSKKFSSGSGNGGSTGSNWYPGDEWKGDIARIYMYMYLRYTDRCKPANACVGNPVTIDLNMVSTLLQWNIEDPVSDFERTRNNKIYNTQHNRNPFIDNAYLATLIWGGDNAENVWTEISVGLKDIQPLEFSIYPNPSTNGKVSIKFNSTESIHQVEVFDISGKVIQTVNNSEITSNLIKFHNLNTGIYFFKISTLTAILTKKVVIK